jgi:hypothetical protein
VRFDEYYELSDKHGWRAADLDWAALEREQIAGLISDFDRQALLATAVIEHGVPHYGEVWTLVERLREHWELWQFTTLWTGEEHRHSFVLKKACDKLRITESIATDLKTVTEFPFAATQKASCAADCYRSVPGMLAYAVIQELATNRFYAIAAKATKSPFLRRMFQLIGGDEMRHHVFYREAMSEIYKTTADREWYSDQIYHAARAFHMPHLIYDVQRPFFEEGQWSIGLRDKIAFKAQLARCLSFDARLIARLMADTSQLEGNGKRKPTPRLGSDIQPR